LRRRAPLRRRRRGVAVCPASAARLRASMPSPHPPVKFARGAAPRIGRGSGKRATKRPLSVAGPGMPAGSSRPVRWARIAGLASALRPVVRAVGLAELVYLDVAPAHGAAHGLLVLALSLADLDLADHASVLRDDGF